MYAIAPYVLRLDAMLLCNGFLTKVADEKLFEVKHYGRLD